MTQAHEAIVRASVSGSTLEFCGRYSAWERRGQATSPCGLLLKAGTEAKGSSWPLEDAGVTCRQFDKKLVMPISAPCRVSDQARSGPRELIWEPFESGGQTKEKRKPRRAYLDVHQEEQRR